jgi:putative ABC transport system ATP-binding protein
MSSIEIKNLIFSYRHEKPVIEITDFVVEKNSTIFLYGPSGVGKSTFLNLVAGILPISKGSLKVLGHNFAEMSSTQKDKIRGEKIGYIFQSFNLIPYLTLKENILLPTMIHPSKEGKSFVQNKAQNLIESLNLNQHQNKLARELSIGQQQRVAAARALIHHPELVIADEPTSSLDQDNTADFLKLLFDQQRELKFSLLFVSHDQRLGKSFQKQFDLRKLGHQ